MFGIHFIRFSGLKGVHLIVAQQAYCFSLCGAQTNIFTQLDFGGWDTLGKY